MPVRCKRLRTLRLEAVLRLQSLEPRHMLEGETFLINFQRAGTPIPSGYESDYGAVYSTKSSGLTYGWSSDHTSVARDRGLHADQRLDTLVHIRAGENWAIALPSGTYAATV